MKKHLADCIADDFLMSLHPAGRSFTPNILIEPPVAGGDETTPPAKSGIIKAVSGRFTGSIADIVEQTLFVSAKHSSIEELGNFEMTGAAQIQIVSSKMKNLIEEFSPPKSEFFPVLVSLGRGGSEFNQDGGGEIIANEYWLWHNFNWIDLIDNDQSDWSKDQGRFTYVDQIRGDLPQNPLQAVRHWGSASNTPGRTLYLKDIDYSANPFFRIVGISGGPFISPQVAQLMAESGMLAHRGDVSIIPTRLNTMNDAEVPEDKRCPRIYGTDIVLPNLQSSPLVSFRA